MFLRFLNRWLVVAVSLALVSGIPEQPAFAEEPPNVDRYGDPLPSGALMRLGTVRLHGANQVAGSVSSADGRIAAYAHRLPGADRCSIVVWNVATGEVIAKKEDLQAIEFDSIKLSPTGARLAVVHWTKPPAGPAKDQAVCIYQTSDLSLVQRMPFDSKFRRSIWFLWDDRPHVCISKEVWDYSALKMIRKYDNPFVAVGNDHWVRHINGAAQLCRLADDAVLSTFKLEGWTYIDLSQDGDHLHVMGKAGGAFEYPLSVIDTKSGEVVWSQRAPVGGLLISKDGRRVAMPDGLYDVKTSEKSFGYVGNPIAFDRDENLVVGQGRGINIFDARTGKPRYVSHSSKLTCLAVDAYGSRLFTASEDFTGRMWDLKTGEQLWVIPTLARYHEISRLKQAIYSPDGASVWTHDGRQIIQLDAHTGQRLKTLKYPDAVKIEDIDLAPDGLQMAIAGSHSDPDHYRKILVVDLKTRGVAVKLIQEHVRSVDFTPDSNSLAACTEKETEKGGPLKVWDLKSGKNTSARDGVRPEVVFLDASTIAYRRPGGETFNDSDKATIVIASLAGEVLQSIPVDGRLDPLLKCGSRIAVLVRRRGRVDEMLFIDPRTVETKQFPLSSTGSEAICLPGGKQFCIFDNSGTGLIYNTP